MNVAGKWYNELGSWMILRVARNRRSLTGKYHSAVGKAVREYDLVGRIDHSPAKRKSQGLGWVVCWENAKRNSHSVTTWSGQYRILGGDEFITTTWLLTNEGTAADDWDSTVVGKDVFTRRMPVAEHVARAKALRGL